MIKVNLFLSFQSDKRFKITFLTPIVLIGLIYLLITLDRKYFIYKKGKLVKIDYKWIYIHIIILILFYISLNNNILKIISKIYLIILILYPLLFPLNEYFIHRIFSLSFASALCWYNYKHNLFNN